MRSKPITAIAKMKSYENSVAKRTEPGTYVNVDGQAHKTNVPQIQSYYTGGNETLIKGASRVTGQMEGPKMSNENWLKYLANETDEQKAKRYKREEAAGARTTEPDKVIKGDGHTTTITSQSTTPVEETRDTYKPWEQRQAARAQKIAGRQFRQAERRFAKGKITEAERDAAKARLDAATESATAGRNVMTSSTYNRPKSGEGLPDFASGETRTVKYDNGDTYTVNDNNPYGYNAALGKGLPDSYAGKAKTNPTQKDGPAAYSPKNSSNASSFRERLDEINQQISDKISNTNLFEENKVFGNAMDFARNIENPDFSGGRGGASNTAYVDKTGAFRDNELERAMSPANKNRSYKMKGFGTKNK